MEREDLNRGYHEHPRRNDPERLAAWRSGMTGYPLIDASMRCLLHTGYMAMAELDPAAAKAGWPGIGVEGAIYLAGFSPVAIGGDTIGTEAQPSEKKGEFVPVHQELIVKRGIYILDDYSFLRSASDEALKENEFIVFPVKTPMGVAGLGLGALTPAFVLFFNAIWGVVAAWWFRFVR